MSFTYKSTGNPREIAEALRRLADRLDASPGTPVTLSAYVDRVSLPADTELHMSDATGNAAFRGARVERMAAYVLLLDAATQDWAREQLGKSWSELRDAGQEGPAPAAPPPLDLTGE